MNKEVKFLKLAREVASNIVSMRTKHCAIITKGKNIISVGVNSKCTHPEMFSRDKIKIYLHAEADAILSSRHKNILGSNMYIARYSPENKNISRPCDICMDLIKENGIKKIIYTTNEGYAIERIKSNGNRKVFSKIY